MGKNRNIYIIHTSKLFRNFLDIFLKYASKQIFIPLCLTRAFEAKLRIFVVIGLYVISISFSMLVQYLQEEKKSAFILLFRNRICQRSE